MTEYSPEVLAFYEFMISSSNSLTDTVTVSDTITDTESGSTSATGDDSVATDTISSDDGSSGSSSGGLFSDGLGTAENLIIVGSFCALVLFIMIFALYRKRKQLQKDRDPSGVNDTYTAAYRPENEYEANHEALEISPGVDSNDTFGESMISFNDSSASEFYSAGNFSSVAPSSNSTTQHVVTAQKSLDSNFESILSDDNSEFVAAARNGFTSNLESAVEEDESTISDSYMTEADDLEVGGGSAAVEDTSTFDSCSTSAFNSSVFSSAFTSGAAGFESDGDEFSLVSDSTFTESFVSEAASDASSCEI